MAAAPLASVVSEEVTDCLANAVDLIYGHSKEQRQRQSLISPAVSVGIRIPLWQEIRQARLPVKRHGIVQAGFDARILQVHTQAIALRRAYHEKVPYVVLVLNGRHVERHPHNTS